MKTLKHTIPKPSLLLLLATVFVVAACGGDVSKKENPKAAVVALEEPTGIVDPGVAAMGSSSGRYEASNSMTCSSTTQSVVNRLRRVANKDWPMESGNYYVYAARVYVDNSFQGEYPVSVNAGAPYNIGLQIASKRSSSGELLQTVYATYALSGWAKLGTIKFSTMSATGDLFTLTPGYAVETTAVSVADDQSGVKGNIIWGLRSTLENSAGFYVEQFSDPSSNQVLLISGKTFKSNGKDYRIDIELGREAQPLKPIACAGYKYPYSQCTHSTFCK